MNICLAGAGAFGIKHLEALAKIDGVKVTSLVGRTREPTEEVARKFGIGHVATDLDESLARRTSTRSSSRRRRRCMRASRSRP
jgi:2-hydroxy-4-carboxymuconate semialdehyde hemiacetal dehydrogenase